MSFSPALQPNTTCDVYRPGRNPPAAPDVTGVPIFLQADFKGGSMSHEVETNAQLRWTHVAMAALAADIRDGYVYGSLAAGGNDTVYVPDQNGTPFQVAFVENAGGYRRVYLNRGTPPWPTSSL